MDRKEFIAKAEQIEKATCELAEQIVDLAKQAEEHKHNWPSDLAGCVEELQECASDIEHCGSLLPFMFKTDDENRRG